MRIACCVEYDGTGFQGWQIQPASRTVQGEVEAALSRVADEPVHTMCAGRTDAGVHAVGQVFHFDTATLRPDRAWLMGGNTHLPADVAIRWARPTDDEFHARFSATDRLYRYVVAEGAARPALWRARLAWSAQSLDVRAMRAAAAQLVGEHDFSAFRTAACRARHPVRSVHFVTVTRRDDLIAIDVRANAFLHNMVRIIVGTLLSVGRGDHPPEWIAELIAGRDRTRGGSTAPAHGLYFLGPRYPAHFRLPERAEACPPLAGEFGV
ncbi:MAG: tRNA pseudouridine(38-40) synthase TruA [Halofilum sp. (in: g-proteobacteria)]